MYQAQLIGATDELVLLTMLHHDRPLYGVEIGDFINEASDYKRFINPGTLYPMLKKLQKEELIISCEVDEEPAQERAGRTRKYYTITEKGRAALRKAENTRRRLVGHDYSWLSC